MAFRKHMWRTDKKHMWRLLESTCARETSKKDYHMPWPPRNLETSRRSIYLALAKKASRMSMCSFVDQLSRL